MKKFLAIGVLAAMSLNVLAADYYVVVPVNRTRAATALSIKVTLNAAALPAATVGSAYTYDLRPALMVTGDSAYTGAGVTWATVSGALPAGVALNNGLLSGVPTAVGEASFTLEATYKTLAARQAYALAVTAPLTEAGTLTGNPAFGTPVVGATVSSTFTYQNSGGLPSSGVYATLSARDGLTLSANTCGTQASPVTLSGYASCTVTVTWNTNLSGSLSGTRLALVSSTGQKAFAELSGTAGGFDAAAVWSTSPNSVVAPTSGSLSHGNRTPNGTGNPITVYLHNAGTYGKMALGVKLTGDTSQFKITAMKSSDRLGWTSDCGATLTSTEAGTCTTATKGGSDGVFLSGYITVTYAPTVVGTHSLTLTPTSSNGTSVPAPITMTGSGVFNAAAAWSMGYNSLVAPTSGDRAFGNRTVNSAPVSKQFYLQNTGTNGQMAMSFVLSGDTSQFQLVSVQKSNYAVTLASCGSTITGNSASTCTTDDKAGGAFPTGQVVVRYAPTVAGNHTVTITPVSSNGTVVTPITLTGSGVFNSVATWSTGYNSVVALTSFDRSYGSRTVNSAPVSKIFYLQNTGTNGQMAMSFVLSGDTSQFQLESVYKSNYAGTPTSCGATITGNSASTCTIDDRAGGSYPTGRLVVRYAPTVAGSHTLTITPVSSNDTVVTPITLTGAGV